MMKQYKTPSVRLVLLDEADIIVTSDPGKNYQLRITGEDTSDSDKAPSRSIWGDD